MTIYLDTNVLPRWGRLTAPHFAALLAVAKTRGEEIVLPRIVVEETVSARRLAARAAFDALSSAHKRASQYSEVVTTYVPSAEEVADEWRDLIEGTFTVIETSGDAAVSALTREAHRVRPAREGRGSRDAAIWLTIIDHFSQANGTSYFVSENTRDFADGANPDSLHPDLAEESKGSGGQQLTYCRNIDDLIEYLAVQIKIEVDQHQIVASGAFEDALRTAIDLDLIPRLTIRRTDSGSSVGTEIYITSPLNIVEVRTTSIRTYGIDDDSYLLLGFSADIGIDVGILARSKKPVREVLLRMEGKVDGRAWIQLDDNNQVANADISKIDKAQLEPVDTDFTISYARAS